MLKKKNLIVIAVSSLIIALVLICTLLGYFAYINFEASRNLWEHTQRLAKAHAKTYSKYVEIRDVKIELSKYKNTPTLTGHIKNTGDKPIASLTMRLRLLNESGKTLYTIIFEPLKFSSPKMQHEYILPNETQFFSYILRNCPKEVLVNLRLKKEWAWGVATDIFAIEFL